MFDHTIKYVYSLLLNVQPGHHDHFILYPTYVGNGVGGTENTCPRYFIYCLV